MQAIETKYLPATTHRGARVKAMNGGGGHEITVSWDSDDDDKGGHWQAAYALACKLGWAGAYVCGGTRAGYVFVMVPCDAIVTTPYRVHEAACA